MPTSLRPPVATLVVTWPLCRPLAGRPTDASASTAVLCAAQKSHLARWPREPGPGCHLPKGPRKKGGPQLDSSAYNTRLARCVDDWSVTSQRICGKEVVVECRSD